jgi:hypothetical protein
MRNTEDSDGAETTDESETKELTTEELRAEVECRYDFENFGPDQMAEMTAAEWETAFDLDTWTRERDFPTSQVTRTGP